MNNAVQASCDERGLSEDKREDTERIHVGGDSEIVQ